MTKTLTEQWRDGELHFGKTYWCSDDEGNVARLVLVSNDRFFEWTLGTEVTKDVKEVLAPVPIYSEYQALKDNCELTHTRLKGTHQKITQLQKKLEIATKALKEYAEEGNWCDCSDWNDMVYQNDLVRCCENGMFGEDGFKPAQQALKEMEGVK